MSQTASPVTSLPDQTLSFPVAAIICVVIGGCVLVIVVSLILRKCLIAQGLECPKWKLDCCECDICLCCKTLAERLDCRTPETKLCLDQICPSKQQCSVFCGQIWSCYYCYMMVDYLKGLDLCRTNACQCPDWTCDSCNCHCTLRMPECSHVSCLCFECDRPEG